MATHVFTRFASYYSPAHGGVVDFQVGQHVDLAMAISDSDVREHYVSNGTVKQLGEETAVAGTQAADASVAETAPPSEPVASVPARPSRSRK